MYRVLYLHPFAAYGGATSSLAEMFAALPRGSVSGVAIAPLGAASRVLESVGMIVTPARGIAQWDDTRFGHYRGTRWLILLREFAYWPFSLLALRRVAPSGPFDLIHCNEITVLLVGMVAKRLFNALLVVHVRSLQRSPAGSFITSRLRKWLRRNADAIVAIDDAVRRSLPLDLAVHVVHNGMAIPERLPVRDQQHPFRVGIIGVLHRSKGVYEFVQAACTLRERGIDARLIVIGENVRTLAGVSGWLLRTFDFARDVRGELETYVAQNRLQELVEFTGFIREKSSIYGALDAVCFPSHLDAPGRPVFEAALFSLPTIVAMREPTSDVVVAGETGICIDAPTPLAIANAIEMLARDRDRARRMGEQARQLALARFDSRLSAQKILEIYRSVCEKHRASASERSSQLRGATPPGQA